jgi:homoserine O-acetyltransferase/O-succinyltransferase
MRFALFLFLASIAGAQTPQQFAGIGDFRLESGQTIQNCRVGYRVYGRLNAQRSNAVLFPTWFSGHSEDLAGLVGAGKLVDSSKFYVITVDALGDGVSSSPSNSAAPFPDITIRDMVNSQHVLVTKYLHLEHLYAVMGISMGGMQTFEWMAAYPDFFDRAIPIVGSPRLTSIDLLLWQAELSAIEAAQKCNCDARGAMEAVNAVHQFALYTPEYRAQKMPPSEFPSFKATLAASRMSPSDWAAQLRAMMSHDIGRGNGGSLAAAAARVKAKTLVVVALQDHMVNPLPALEIAGRLNARTLQLTGNCGHMAPTCEADRMNPVAGVFLADGISHQSQ